MGGEAQLYRPKKGLCAHHKEGFMLHFVSVHLKEVFEQGTNFKWPRPACCPRCNHYKVWGHGFVSRLFDSFASTFLIKRFRCPDCGCVITCRPSTHFSRIQADKTVVRHSLSNRLTIGRWSEGISSSRQRHWLFNLQRKAKARLSDVWRQGLMAAYDRLLELGYVPVSRSI